MSRIKKPKGDSCRCIGCRRWRLIGKRKKIRQDRRMQERSDERS